MLRRSKEFPMRHPPFQKGSPKSLHSTGRASAFKGLAGVTVLSICLTGAMLTPTVGQGGAPASQGEVAVKLHQKVARSTAWIVSPRGSTGTGWLVDAGNRYLVTARHVVQEGRGIAKTVDVLFAQFNEAGEVITDKGHYEKHKEQLAIKGKVVYESVERDMAVLQLARLPEGVLALPLAARNPLPGQEVHVIGNSSTSFGGLFGYNAGRVRNVFRWVLRSGAIKADVVAHYCPTNQGDSGGPVVNQRGEVVAFISQGTTGGMTPSRVIGTVQALQQGQRLADSPFDVQQVLDHSIAVSEIRTGLDSLAPGSLGTAEPTSVRR
jgi:S1-C subfamily serine protease